MTEEQAEQQLYSLMSPEDGAMIPVGLVNQLIHDIYKEESNCHNCAYLNLGAIDYPCSDCTVLKTNHWELNKEKK